MFSTTAETPADPGISYEGPALVEITIEDKDFRIDPGKQGTALCISTRPSGTWDWSFGGEARWDGSQLRSKQFERRVLLELSSALSGSLADSA